HGRALQMNAGAEKATGDVLLFLHADTRLPPAAEHVILNRLAHTGRAWGRFDVTIAGRHPMLAVVSRLMNIRSRMTGIATGDQAIFVKRDAFAAAGGYPPIALMEHIALCKRLKRIGPPLCLAERVVTSGRRWERHGGLTTILLMLRLGVDSCSGADRCRVADGCR